MAKLNKKFAIGSLLAATASLAVVILHTQGFIFMQEDAGAAYAATSLCKTSEQAMEIANFTYPLPPTNIGNRSLQCIVPESDMVVFVYSGKPLTGDPYDSMTSDNSILVRASDVTKGGTKHIDVKKAYEELQVDVMADRPDLKPRLLTINGYPGWGTEGGDNLSITEIQDSNGNVEERYTSPAPSSLLVTINDTSYSFDGYVPLSELVELAESFAE